MTPAEKAEALVRRYYAMCNAADRQGLIDCFTPDGAHYFPPGLPGIPWRGAEAVADGWLWCVRELGSRWTLDGFMARADGREGVCEWTHWTTRGAPAHLRGAELYVFDEEVERIVEIRAYFAAAVTKGAAASELRGFDYAARGWPLAPPGPAPDPAPDPVVEPTARRRAGDGGEAGGEAGG